MNKAKGPVWPKKQKKQGIISKGSSELIKRLLGINLMLTIGYMAMGYSS